MVTGDEKVKFHRVLFPPYQKIPKPRRRTELGLLLLVWIIIALLYSLTFIGSKNHLPPHVVTFLGILLCLTMGIHLVNRWLVPHSNPVLLPLATLLNGLGYVEIVRWNPPAAQQQATWTILGAVLYTLTLLVVRRTRDLDRYRYIILVIAIILLLSPLFPIVGTSINGARLWVHFGTTLQFQPVEIGKILLVIFFASYFTQKKELLSLSTRRFGNRLVLDPKPLIPVLATWGLAMMVLGAENDIGFAMLLFTLFIAMLWVATGRSLYLLLGVVLFAVGGFLAIHFFHQVNERIAIWLNPWPLAQGNGLQLVQSYYSLATGGVGGTGLGLGQAGLYVPFLTSDMIFTAVGEEMGFMGSSIVIIIFALMVGAGLNIAQRARSEFAKLCATGLTIIIGFQSFFIMAGVLRLLPFTGITLPFVARGGSSLIANYVVIALLLRISDETGPDWITDSAERKPAHARR